MRYLLFIIILAFFSCKKSNINEHLEFIGVWQASQNDADYEIIINENGAASYEKITTNTKVYADGGFLFKSDGEIKIGIKKFSLDEYPNQSSATEPWTMTLDDVQYSKE